MALGSSRPYLIRALYDWIVNGGEDPYVVVDCFYPGVEVPESHVKDGQIVLNLAPRALKAWNTSDFGLMFQTRFSGVPTDLVLPYGAITASYGKESVRSRVGYLNYPTPMFLRRPLNPLRMKFLWNLRHLSASGPHCEL